MKVGVIQALDTSNFNEYQLEQFWQPCINSVKRWAQSLNYGYHFYNTPLTKIDVKNNLDTSWVSDSKTRINQFFKFDWMRDQVDNYDVLLWVDADIFCWGTPVFLKPSSNFYDKFYAGNYVKIFNYYPDGWDRVTLSVFWAPSNLIAEVADWLDRQILQPELRSDLFKTLLTTCNSLKVDFTEEIAFTVWYYQNKERCHLYKTADVGSGRHKFDDCVNWYIGCTDKEILAHRDQFIHFGGDKKIRDKQRFDAYRAYLAYEEGRNIWIK